MKNPYSYSYGTWRLPLGKLVIISRLAPPVEHGLVLSSVVFGAYRHNEKIKGPKLFVGKPIGPLGERPVRGALEQERKGFESGIRRRLCRYRD